jgi:hypothetical protein
MIRRTPTNSHGAIAAALGRLREELAVVCQVLDHSREELEWTNPNPPNR